MNLPIGISDFATIIENKIGYVDKTLMIKDFIDDEETIVTLITRPRRFGKTMNMSMLQHYFANEVQGKPTRHLFNNLHISHCDASYLEHQGKYPVVFMSFKDVKNENFNHAYNKFKKLLSDVFDQFNYLLDSPHLSETQKESFTAVLKGNMESEIFETALRDLTKYLYLHFNVKPILLIDEYDTPIQSGYMHGYYDDVISFMRSLLGAGLKGNPNLHKAVLTGILRVSKESLFSGLNNLEVYSMLRNEYSQYFGFTENEMSALLKNVKFEHSAKEIKDWYNGYQIGDTIIYNPWSIANCIKQNGALKPYWVNTSDNVLIKQSMERSDAEFKSDFESLLKNIPSEQLMPEYFVFGNLESDPTTLWSLMLEAGYLKSVETKQEGTKVRCQLLPPNQEVMALLTDTIVDWFQTPLKGERRYHEFLKNLLTGNVSEFTLRLQDFLEESASHFDTKGKHPEKFYHGFVLGLIASLEKTHVVKSNRESGYGRYDVMIIPKDKTQNGVILEFKNASSEQNLNQAAEEALQQINDKNYEAELRQMGIKSILKLGLAFHGKKVCVISS